MFFLSDLRAQRFESTPIGFVAAASAAAAAAAAVADVAACTQPAPRGAFAWALLDAFLGQTAVAVVAVAAVVVSACTQPAPRDALAQARRGACWDALLASMGFRPASAPAS